MCGWGQCSLSTVPVTTRCIPVPICLATSHPRKEIMIQATRSCWPSRWPLKNEGTGWKEHSGPSSCGLTDKNLQYVQTAKRLNSCQARWALFFNCFDFCLPYRPGSKNWKPDTLSRMYSPDPSPEASSNILPLSCAVGAVTWGIEGKVQRADANITPPRGCPPH